MQILFLRTDLDQSDEGKAEVARILAKAKKDDAKLQKEQADMKVYLLKIVLMFKECGPFVAGRYCYSLLSWKENKFCTVFRSPFCNHKKQ